MQRCQKNNLFQNEKLNKTENPHKNGKNSMLFQKITKINKKKCKRIKKNLLPIENIKKNKNRKKIIC